MLPVRQTLAAPPLPAVYREMVAQLSLEARKYLFFTEDGQLLISNTHRFRPEVGGFIAQLKRKNVPFEQQYVDLPVILEMQEATATALHVRDASDMQRAARLVFEKAVALRASDIHIRNSKQKGTTIRMRIHGDLEMVEEHPYVWGDQLCSTIYQAMSDISDSTFEPLSHQDARISNRSKMPDGIDGIRVATTPQVDGYVMVMRLLYNDTVDSFDLALLGYLPPQVAAIDLLKRRPHGVNIIAGPTGSGKSTTLQRTLGSIIRESEGRKHVITVEDPPEYPIPGAVQTPVTNADSLEARSLAFQSAIRAAMRLDPDVIMIGEIRDTPSARLAFQAAMTGHQVWTTLHANDAYSIFQRLLDLGVPLNMLADHSIITGITCQRLVKLLCPHCKQLLLDVADRFPETHVRRVKSVMDVSNVYVTGNGCDHKDCRKGIAGRTVVAETIMTDAYFMDQVRTENRIGAINYWMSELNGMTMLGHAIQIVERGLVDPFKAEDVVGPLNMDALKAGVQEMGHDYA